MRLCDNHWNQLKTAIDDAGLSHLQVNDRELAIRLTGVPVNFMRPEEVDALNTAHAVLLTLLIDAQGPRILRLDGCGLCYCVEDHAKFCEDPACLDHFHTWPKVVIERVHHLIDPVLGITADTPVKVM